jgi:hypothetical protein
LPEPFAHDADLVTADGRGKILNSFYARRRPRRRGRSSTHRVTDIPFR